MRKGIANYERPCPICQKDIKKGEPVAYQYGIYGDCWVHPGCYKPVAGIKKGVRL